MSYLFTKQEEKELNKIKQKYYMPPTLNRIHNFIDSHSDKKEAWRLVFDELNCIIQDAYTEVEVILERRKSQGKIRNKSQANKTVVGNTFPFAVIYIFLQNKKIGNIKKRIFITSELSKIKDIGFDKISVIKIGNDTQKPDCDLAIYTLTNENELQNCIIMSLKTSLRERAAQTYKWKLLMEIASSNESNLKDKYEISYDVPKIPLICFATVNFYNEINNPQQRGMLKFFDKAFLANTLDHPLPDFISPMSELVNFVNEEI